MEFPIIGITTSYQSNDAPQQTLNQNYVLAVERAGGCPIIIPMTDQPETGDPILQQLSGLIITGGPGITDGLIGELPDELPPVSPMRHQNDCYAFQMAQKMQIPMLGICYGMQFINAQFGGTLYADVQHQCKTAPHSPKRTSGKPIQHAIEIEPKSHLQNILKVSACETHSFHLQAIETIGSGLRINAKSTDGVIEGIETRDGRILGLQFHPEKMPNTIFDRIFKHVVQLASKSIPCPIT